MTNNTEVVEKSREFRVYRPYEGKGAASKWQLSWKPENKYDKYILFLTVAKESGKDDKGNPIFDWKDGGVTVKMGENDIGSFLALLQGKQDSVKLFHESPNGGNKVVECKYNSEKNNYWFSVSAQDAEKNKVSFAHGLNLSEGAILEVLLRTSINRMYNW